MERAEVVVAGEDEVHRALGHWFVRRVKPTAEFVGIRPHERDWFCYKGSADLIRRALNLPPGKPIFRDLKGALTGYPLARQYVDAVQVVHGTRNTADFLVILVDTDGKPEVGPAMEAVRRWCTERNLKQKLVIGSIEQDAEAWIVAGLAYDAGTQVQRRKAARQLNFDPCSHPHRLTHAPNHADQDAKRVLAFLLGEEDKLSSHASVPPDARTVNDLLARAFVKLDELVKTPAARATGLTDFHEELEKTFR